VVYKASDPAEPERETVKTVVSIVAVIFSVLLAALFPK
jgi:hypothetical protein